ncbi:Inositol-1-monophosphatase [hydrothermal vent metagenome]|uniref:inositol-phosphate phosphatase n=1 Tax=hydrothermal vent metagenome TaxID=652676 RepID=A0A3B0ZZR9_9ZZZZ
MHPLLNIAIRAARNAGEIITRSADRIDQLTIVKKAANDFVSEIDKKAELEIIETIHKAYPEHGILAEESGIQKGNEFTWIIDPLDGTTNFLHGFPQFAVSIAVKNKDRIEHAVVYDPMRDELFTASRGDGAQLNNKRIRVTPQVKLTGSLIGTGFPYSNMEYLEPYMDMLKSFIQKTAGIRRPGSAALDLAYVAAGRIDGFWELDLKTWDLAAGSLLVQEAGGLVSDLSGNNNYLDSGHIVCANPKLFKAMLQEIRPHLTQDLK